MKHRMSVFHPTDIQKVVQASNDIDSQGTTKDSHMAGLMVTSKRKGHSSLGYRQQAENLMAQLKQDMKGSKRIFSTDATDISPNVDDASRSVRLLPMPSPPHRSLRSLPPTVQRGNSSRSSLVVFF